MGKKKRKFIDKRYDNIYSFKVVPRSQKDPLIADEAAPQGVLVETNSTKEEQKEELHKYGIYFDDDYDYLQHMRGVKEEIDWGNCELEVYTIRKEDPKRKKRSKIEIGVELPSSAFESYVEEPVGLLNKAASVADLGSDVDSDIIAALNSDEEAEMIDPDDEEAIPDNFVSMLNADDVIEEEEDEEEENFSHHSKASEDEKSDASVEYNGIHNWLSNTEIYDQDPSNFKVDYREMPALEESSEDELFHDESGDENLNYDADLDADEERDEVRSLPSASRKKRRSAKKEDTTTTTTTTTNDSSVHRTELQKFFDLKFENFYEREYADDQYDLDSDLIEGGLDVDHPAFKQAMEATRKQLEKLNLGSMNGEDKDRTVLWVKNNMMLRNYMLDEEEELVDVEIETKPKYDLRSFHEARSERLHIIRPKLLDDFLFPRSNKLTKKAIKEHNKAYRDDDDESSSDSESEEDGYTLLSQISMCSERPKNETPQERRARKIHLKQLRKLRREEKKVNKILYSKGERGEKQKRLSTHRIIKLGV